MNNMNNMKNKIFYYWATAVTLIMGMEAQAETAYVNDRIFLGVYAEPKTDGKVEHTLQSGVKLEVLERVEGFARIQTETGQHGWVRDSFIAEQKPASMRIKEVEMERDKLQETLKAIPNNDDLIVVKNDLAKAEEQVKQLKALLEEQRAASKDVEKYAPSTIIEKPLLDSVINVSGSHWRERFFIAVIFSLVGLGSGIAFMGQRIKKRFGGYKVW